jgi:hypothetical protein
MWHEVGRLRATFACQGCSHEVHLPVEPRWSFRLNELVAQALDREGVLATLLALGELDFRSDMLLYLPPQDIAEDYDEHEFTDVDLLFVTKRRFCMAEVKSDPAAFEPSGLERLATVAEDFRPDVILLAAPGVSWPDDVQTHFNNFSDRLCRIDVKVKPWLMSWNYPKAVLEL